MSVPSPTWHTRGIVSAFVTVTDVAEIIGNHIKDNEYKEMLEKIEEKEEPLNSLPEHESMKDFEGLKRS